MSYEAIKAGLSGLSGLFERSAPAQPGKSALAAGLSALLALVEGLPGEPVQSTATPNTGIGPVVLTSLAMPPTSGSTLKELADSALHAAQALDDAVTSGGAA